MEFSFISLQNFNIKTKHQHIIVNYCNKFTEFIIYQMRFHGNCITTTTTNKYNYVSFYYEDLYYMRVLVVNVNMPFQLSYFCRYCFYTSFSFLFLVFFSLIKINILLLLLLSFQVSAFPIFMPHCHSASSIILISLWYVLMQLLCVMHIEFFHYFFLVNSNCMMMMISALHSITCKLKPRNIFENHRLKNQKLIHIVFECIVCTI